jgi:hypothetical protein
VREKEADDEVGILKSKQSQSAAANFLSFIDIYLSRVNKFLKKIFISSSHILPIIVHESGLQCVEIQRECKYAAA